MWINAREYVEGGAHLPLEFRDFHDQKELFKTIDASIDWEARAGLPGGKPCLGWTDAHVYVIDIFLWFMAQRGWTLQRSRAHVDFRTYRDDLRTRQESETGLFQEVLSRGPGATPLAPGAPPVQE